MHKTTKIEALGATDSTMPSSTAALTTKNSWAKQKYFDIPVAKAREFESFKQIPKYTHAPLAVICPPPWRQTKEPRHVPPRTLAFDGSRVELGIRPTASKAEIPDHLVRPPIDEEALMRIKERSKLKLQQSR